MPVLIFPLRKSAAQVFLWHETMQHYNACLRSVSSQDRFRRIHPNGRHTWRRCKGHTEGIWNLVSPCGNDSYLIDLIDRWMGTFLHMQVSYRRNQNG